MTVRAIAAGLVMLLVLPVNAAMDASWSTTQSTHVDVLTTTATEPAEAARILEDVTRRGGLTGVTVTTVEDAAAYREHVRTSRASVLVLVGHGTPRGLEVNDETIPWSSVAADVAASRAKHVLVLACDSAGLPDIDGTRIVLAYPGAVDLEVAALDAAFELGNLLLVGESLEAYADAHSTFVEETGGALRYFVLMNSPERPLDPRPTRNPCTYSYNNWWSPGSARYDGSDRCRALKVYGAVDSVGPVRTENPTCTRFDCRVTAQEQQGYEDDMEENSWFKTSFGASASPEFRDLPPGMRFLKDIVSFGFDVQDDGRDYKFFVSIGNPIKDDAGRVQYKGKWSGTCYPFVDVLDAAVPALPAIEQSLQRVPGVKSANVHGFSIMICASLKGGLLQNRSAGSLDGQIDLRAITGVDVQVKVWWVTKTIKTEVTLSYPFGASADIGDTGSAITFDLSMSFGPLTAQLQSNVFHMYMSAQIPATARKFDMVHTRWPYAEGGSAAARHVALDASVLRALESLPDGVVRVGDPDALRVPLGAGGEAVPLADIVETVPGDGYWNHLRGTGRFTALGIDPEAVPAGSSVFLDLSNPRVHQILTGNGFSQSRALLGIPGDGVLVAGSTCVAKGLGTVLAITVEGCDSDRPVVGLTMLATEDPTHTGVPGAAKGLVTTSASAGIETTRGVTCTGAGTVTSPLSGNTYSPRDVCRMLTYDSAVAEGNNVIRKGLEGHRTKTILEDLGLFSWLTDACSTAISSAVAENAGHCFTLEPISTDATVEGAAPLTAAAVIDQFVQGYEELSSMGSGGSGFTGEGSSHDVFINAWADSEPTTNAIGAELGAIGQPGVGDAVREVECTIRDAVLGTCEGGSSS